MTDKPRRSDRQKTANKIDMDWFHLCENAAAFADSVRNDELRAFVSVMWSRRHLVRDYMHEDDRAATS